MKQAVTESDAAEDQTVEKEGAPDDLDSLLDQYAEETKPVEQPKIDGLEEVVGWVNEQREEKASQTIETDLKDAVGSIQEELKDLDFKPSDRVVRGMLEALAIEDKSIKKAFETRRENPRAWQAALKRAASELKTDFSVDQQTTSDREAIASAVHNASNKQPEPDKGANLSGMSDYEFQKHKAELLRGG